MIDKIVKIEAATAYNRYGWRVRRWADREDFEQYIYFKLVRDGLIDSDDKMAIVITACRRAVIEFIRTVYKRGSVWPFEYSLNGVEDLMLSDKNHLSKIDDMLSMKSLLSMMGDRERSIMEMMMDGQSQREIAKKIGVDPSRINQIIGKAVMELHEAATGHRNDAFFCVNHPNRIVVNKKHRLCAGCATMKFRRGVQ